jgi:hypothetical protein
VGYCFRIDVKQRDFGVVLREGPLDHAEMARLQKQKQDKANRRLILRKTRIGQGAYSPGVSGMRNLRILIGATALLILVVGVLGWGKGVGRETPALEKRATQAAASSTARLQGSVHDEGSARKDKNNDSGSQKTNASTPSESTGPPSGQGTQMILVENPRFNRDKPVLFDSRLETDNSSCMVCHADFEEEPISAVHLKAGITCMGCHGDSLAHRGDEFNVVKPDVIWGRAEIEPFCKQCHPQHRDPTGVEAYRQKNLGNRRENGRYVRKDSPCTDCHGKHAIVPAEGNFR